MSTRTGRSNAQGVALTLAITCGAFVSMALPTVSSAQSLSYPTRAVTLILPVPAGGLQDSLTRPLAQELSKKWKQPVIVENRAGGSGVIAASAVTRSAPDGYTILVNDNVSLVVNQLTKEGLPYDGMRDLVPVAGVAQAGNVLIVSGSSSVKTVKDLVAKAKAMPGKLNYGSFGVGTASHVDTVALARAADIDVTHVPYKGGPEIITAIISNDQLDFSMTGLPPALPFIRQGKLRALAYGGSTRSSVMPDVPTFAEAGVPGFESFAWFPWFMPAATPRAIVEKVSADIAEVLQSKEFVERVITNVGLEVAYRSPSQAKEMLQADYTNMSARLKLLSVKN